jgi:NAD(P)-dependent dehydrogenase (short-subunit alcohol dehydrogenase family)
MANYLIIGGTKGIGASVVKQLLVLNQNIYVGSRSIGNEKGVRYFGYDASKDTPSFDLPEVLDGLVYCPGSINLKPFGRITQEDFWNDFQINVLGAIKTIQYALPSLKKSSQASIVLFSTVAVQTGMPFHASVASAKGAVEGLTRSLAAEFAPTIRVNCVAPSLTDTPLAEKLLNTPEKRESANKRHPLQQIGAPDDIAALAVFLLTGQSKFITGQILKADGGISSLKL